MHESSGCCVGTEGGAGGAEAEAVAAAGERGQQTAAQQRQSSRERRPMTRGVAAAASGCPLAAAAAVSTVAVMLVLAACWHPGSLTCTGVYLPEPQPSTAGEPTAARPRGGLFRRWTRCRAGADWTQCRAGRASAALRVPRHCLGHAEHWAARLQGQGMPCSCKGSSHAGILPLQPASLLAEPRAGIQGGTVAILAPLPALDGPTL